MLHSLFRLVLLAVTVPFTVAVLSMALIYTGIVRRGIWMLVNVFIGTVIAIVQSLPTEKNQVDSSRPHTWTFLLVALITFGTVFYQNIIPLPYTHYLKYLNSIEFQILGYDDLTDDSDGYAVLHQPKAALYKKNFDNGETSTVIPFWKLGKSEAQLHHAGKTNYFFFVDPLKWASSLTLLPKFVYVVMLLYAIWLTLFSRTFDVLLYRWML
ncbi:hypothetical protein ABXZ88_003946 [Vibrio fluvialis]